ncbi:MAG: hypothetical protein BroJett014_24830 [Planctomycetota bacterium]|nr:MAG: hypothetical protein BroJett014_24830 [Planctomycetota bacterium]
MSIKQKRFAIHIGFIVLVSVIQLAGCNTKEGASTRTPTAFIPSTVSLFPPPTVDLESTPESATPVQFTPVSIQIDGETVTLVPGNNISSENYLLAQTPEFNAAARWELINDMWEPLAPGVTIPLDICDVNPVHLDCVGMHDPTPTMMLEISPTLLTFTDSLGRFAFDYPFGWSTAPLTPRPEDGIQVLDGPSLAQANRWISLTVFPNPDQLPLSDWVAEKGYVYSGIVIEETEDMINTVPVIRQTLQNEAPKSGEPYTYAMIWWSQGDNILLWTAWPGEQSETLNILERMVTGFRSFE